MGNVVKINPENNSKIIMAITLSLFIILIGLIFVVLIIFAKTIRIVPQKTAFIIERLGKYTDSLLAGLHILVPFIDKVAYRHTLKEQALDVPSQVCITKDNISVEEAYRQHIKKCHEVGLHSSRAVLKRLRSMPKRYPELNELR